MRIRCPACDYVREVSSEKIPPSAEFASCPKCRHRFRFRALGAGGVSPGEQAAAPEEKPEEKPGDIWEAMDSLTGRWTGGDAEKTGRDAGDEAGGEPGGEARKQQARREAERSGGAREAAQAARGGAPWAIPWERPRELGFFPSLVRTMLLALLQPSRFFAHVTPDLPLIPALFYYVVFGLLQYVCDILWSNLAVRMAGPEVLANLPPAVVQSLDFSRLPMIVVTAPFLLALQMFVTTAVLHLMVRLVDPAEASFPKTFKVVAYAASALILTAVPLLGPLIGPAWYAALLALGCRHAFRLHWGKTLMVMIPLFFLMLFGAMAQYGSFLA